MKRILKFPPLDELALLQGLARVRRSFSRRRSPRVGSKSPVSPVSPASPASPPASSATESSAATSFVKELTATTAEASEMSAATTTSDISVAGEEGEAVGYYQPMGSKVTKIMMVLMIVLYSMIWGAPLISEIDDMEKEDAADPKSAIFSFACKGFWLTLLVFLIRCIESYTIAVDVRSWDEQRGYNIHMWIRTYIRYSVPTFGLKMLMILFVLYVYGVALASCVQTCMVLLNKKTIFRTMELQDMPIIPLAHFVPADYSTGSATYATCAPALAVAKTTTSGVATSAKASTTTYAFATTTRTDT
ncbi:hypothetical protein HPB50_005561 [Hyalomma asiaticum]|uniref:Uncharacterized protein n=1 Tax=Hyalomma asiaticum TaxID=266040 RepID=A0ACB7SKA9_HYAAI|nr:hypothetical protein HPB50_005561 [Hyalomma asiaticum]